MLEKVLLWGLRPAQISGKRTASNLPKIEGLCAKIALTLLSLIAVRIDCVQCHSAHHSRCNFPKTKMYHESKPPNTTTDMEECESLYKLYSDSIPDNKTVIFQMTQRIPRADSLFYTPVSIANGPTLKAMIDSGSMACTLSKGAEASLFTFYSGHENIFGG